MKSAAARHGCGRRLGLWILCWSLVVALGLALGLWQWQRAADKRELLARYETAPRLEDPVVAPPDGARLTLHGEYLAAETLFLDNRTHDNRLGVAALTPLRGDDGRLWLVERGFLATGPRRDTPTVTTPEGAVTLSGRWQVAGDSAPLFGPNREGRRLQRIALSAWPALGGFAHAGWLHLESGPGHLASWWTPSVLPPERHLAYAMQWWGLAIAALMVMTLGGRRLVRDRTSSSVSKPRPEE
ncbi:SURF1 family protein [Halomonas getboli]|uniref:SURF1 family protein n=1 Tax=Halomonas getboli TaxID=2935862 RepID=UPI001FFF85EE|nr:SURF1 family protein [Halomonas getboli]